MSALTAGAWIRNTRTGLVRQVLEVRHGVEVIVGLPLGWGTRCWSITECEVI